jgi:ABC-2 type transport system ATP-binding protein/lipopolysaccharide transport system ATP-binding protein
MASIELRDISLYYPVLQPVDLSMKSALRTLAPGGEIRRLGRRSIEVRALEGINLTLKDGERLGVIGHNGAGKTTFLKVLAGIYRAQRGSFKRSGRLAAVINPANGLQMEISGRENIENMGLLSGLSHAEIQDRIPEIEEFTELGDFLSLPVGTYSTGMMMRLAFAVATSLSPDILVADENLSTGDARFVQRAKERMLAMMKRSSLLVLASHSLEMLPTLVNRAILLERGHIVADGPVRDVIAQYRASAVEQTIQ